METTPIELTPAQKGILAILSQETGEPVSDLIDKALDELQERLHSRRANGAKHAPPARKVNGKQEKPTHSILDIFRPAWDAIPEEELEGLPTDLAANVDHYIYGLPKRFE